MGGGGKNSKEVKRGIPAREKTSPGPPRRISQKNGGSKKTEMGGGEKKGKKGSWGGRKKKGGFSRSGMKALRAH